MTTPTELPIQADNQTCPECYNYDNTQGVDPEFIHCNNCGYEGPPLDPKTALDTSDYLGALWASPY